MLFHITRAALGVAIAAGLAGCVSRFIQNPPSLTPAAYANCLKGDDYFSQVPGLLDATDERASALAYKALLNEIVRGSAFTAVAGNAGHNPVKTDVKGADPVKESGKATSYVAANDHRYVESAAYASTMEHAPIQHFLDCYAGKVEPLDYDARLLRGHVMVTMMAEWIAFTLEGVSDNVRAEIAAEAFKLVRDTEIGLRASSLAYVSTQFKADDALRDSIAAMRKSAGRHIYNVRRIEGVLRLAAVGFKAEVYQFATFFERTISSVAQAVGGSAVTSALKDIAGQSVEGFARAAKVQVYGTAFFRMSGETLGKLYGPALAAKSQHGTADDAIDAIYEANKGQYWIEWTPWDARLKSACAELAVYAKEQASCAPTPADVKAFLEREGIAAPPEKEEVKGADPAAAATE